MSDIWTIPSCRDTVFILHIHLIIAWWQLDINDTKLITTQYKSRQERHTSSASSKAPRGSTAPSSNATIGDIVYLRDGKTKHHPRDRFLVVDKDSSWLYIRKFVGSQFRQASYKVKSEEIFRVLEYNSPSAYHKPSRDMESDGENDCNDSSQVLDGRNDD